MFPRLPLVVCALGLVSGCAAEQIDAEPDQPSGGSGAVAGSGSGGGAAAGSSTGGKPSMAGSSSGGTSSSAGTTSTAGTSGTGVAGTSSSGSGGGGANGAGGTTGGGGTSGGNTGGGGKANTNLPFSEDFEDGSAQGFMPWNEDMTQGTWAVVADGAGKVYQPTAAVGDLEFAVGGSTSWTDVSLKVKVRLATADSGAQIVIRFKDAKTYLFVEMAEGKYKLRGRANGSTQDLISPSPKPTIAAGTWYTVGIVIKGTTASLTLNDMPIGGSVMCSALISNGGVALGVAEGSVAFDDLSITAAP